MGIAFEGTVVLQRYLARDVPTGKGVGELKRAVHNQFGIETAVGSIVDVFKEDAVHGRLYGCPQLRGFHVKDV